MCLAIPARVTELLDDDQVRVALDGVSKCISAALIEDVRIGDYLIVHVGYAIGRIDAAQAEETLALLREMGTRQTDPAAWL